MTLVRLELTVGGRVIVIFFGIEFGSASIHLRIGAHLLRPNLQPRFFVRHLSVSIPWLNRIRATPQYPGGPQWNPRISSRYDAYRGSITATVDGLYRTPDYRQGFDTGRNEPVEEALRDAYWAQHSERRRDRHFYVTRLLSVAAGRNLVRLLAGYSGHPLLAEGLRPEERLQLEYGGHRSSEDGSELEGSGSDREFLGD